MTLSLAPQYVALGTQADAEIARITAKPTDGHWAGASSVLGGQVDAAIAAAVPPPPPHSIIFGCSTPGKDTLHPAMIRCYDGGMPSAPLTGTNPGVPVSASAKPPVGNLAKHDPATVAATKAWLHAFSKGYATIQHECENPSKNINPTAYKSDWPAFLDLIDAENKARGRVDIVGVPIFMGYSLDPKAKRDIAATWMPTDPRIKTVGFDCYHTNHLLLAHDFKVKYGLRWIVPEYGWGTIGNDPTPTDEQYDQRILADVKTMRLLPATEQPDAMLLWDQSLDAVENDPITKALWIALSTGAA